MVVIKETFKKFVLKKSFVMKYAIQIVPIKCFEHFKASKTY